MPSRLCVTHRFSGKTARKKSRILWGNAKVWHVNSNQNKLQPTDRVKEENMEGLSVGTDENVLKY